MHRDSESCEPLRTAANTTHSQVQCTRYREDEIRRQTHHSYMTPSDEDFAHGLKIIRMGSARTSLSYTVENGFREWAALSHYWSLGQR